MISEKNKRVKVLVIVGPTASGKSKLAWKLKKYIDNGPPSLKLWRGAEIISADSRQVYRGLDIGTGKEQFPQHLIDVADPTEDYNVSHFVRDAKKAIADITARGNLPIIVGGTGFWVDSLIFGTKIPEVKPNAELRRELETHTADELFEKLRKLDEFRAKHIDKHNKRRLIRAIEIAISPAGAPPLTDKRGLGGDSLWIGIKMSKEELDQRIKKRLNTWFEHGLIEETKKLPNPERFGLAYTAIAKYLKGEINEAEMRAQSLQSICQYAKRQMTWFKRNKNIIWITSPSEVEPPLPDWLSLSSRP